MPGNKKAINPLAQLKHGEMKVCVLTASMNSVLVNMATQSIENMPDGSAYVKLDAGKANNIIHDVTHELDYIVRHNAFWRSNPKFSK